VAFPATQRFRRETVLVSTSAKTAVEVRAGSDGDRFAGAEGRAFRVLPKRVSIAPLMLAVMGLLVHSEHRRTLEGPRNRVLAASK
jgi:hypothetical protein